MINIFEVNETNKMIEQENLDVRTITMGISLLDCIDSAVCGDHPTILEPIDYEQEVCEETAGRFATRDEQ